MEKLHVLDREIFGTDLGIVLWRKYAARGGNICGVEAEIRG